MTILGSLLRGPRLTSSHPLPLALVAGVTILAATGCRRADLGIPPTVCSTQAVSAAESELMEPGGDCIGCHSSGEGPSFSVAGTVMAALRDDTNCRGVEGVTVRLTGADGGQLDLVTNANGNFFLRAGRGALTFPYHAEVIHNGVTTPMLAARTEGETDCNSCHTAAGANTAPGRIVAP